MKFRDHEYYVVSLERMNQAQKLYEQGDAYALAMYCAGLAVESLFRAFRWKNNQSFDGRHNLGELLKASGILRVHEEYLLRKGKSEIEILEVSREFRVNMNRIVILWNNNLRFASEKHLQAYLNGIGKVQGVKGDAKKKNAKDLINASKMIIDRGIVLWESKKKS